jgi:hypothetical protein
MNLFAIGDAAIVFPSRSLLGEAEVMRARLFGWRR